MPARGRHKDVRKAERNCGPASPNAAERVQGLLDASACFAQIPSRTDPRPAQSVIARPCAALLSIKSDEAGYERAIDYPWALLAECTNGTLPDCERALMLAGSEGAPEDVRAVLLSVRAAERGYALLG